MSQWKTMREVAQELGVSKRVIKYHKEKLGFFETRLENGVIIISPEGIEKLKSFIRPKEYSQRFEAEVLKRLEVIEKGVKSNHFTNCPPKEVIRSFWQYLIRTSNVLEALKELQQEELSSSREGSFYAEVAYYVNLEHELEEFCSHFDSEVNRID
ncbi:hypothetical protein [Streptococcus canis]|uniref:hypothetical protein n=1 Tax=Streptococcus canis TaxID=1329 RepID=UPI003B67A202